MEKQNLLKSMCQGGRLERTEQAEWSGAQPYTAGALRIRGVERRECGEPSGSRRGVDSRS